MTAVTGRKSFVRAGEPVGVLGGTDSRYCREGDALVVRPDERWGTPLFADACLEEADFHVHARLTLDRLAGTGASVLLGGHYQDAWSRPEGNHTFRICLDEDRYPAPKRPDKVMQIVHGRTDPHQPWFPADDTAEKQVVGACREFFRPGAPFAIDIVRRGPDLTFAIDGRDVFCHRLDDGSRLAVGRRGDAGWPISVGFLPGRGTIRIHDWWAEGRFPGPSLPTVDVWRLNAGDYALYRIPSLCGTPGGRLLAFCEARRAWRSRGWEWDRGRGAEILASEIHCVMKHSDDHGRTWSEQAILIDRGASYEARDPTPLADRDTGELFLFTRGGPWVMSSRDEGRTWSEPRSLADAAPGEFRDFTPGTANSAIQLRHGPHRGRLLLALYANNAIGLIVSDDHGRTWRPGALAAHGGASEPTVAELSDGRVLVSPRLMMGAPGRGRLFLVSEDGGLLFSGSRHEPALPMPGQGELLAVDPPDPAAAGAVRPIVFCGAAEQKTRLTLRISLDDGRTWPVARVLDDGSAANLALVALSGGAVGVLYERDQYRRLSFQRVDLAAVLKDG